MKNLIQWNELAVFVFLISVLLLFGIDARAAEPAVESVVELAVEPVVELAVEPVVELAVEPVKNYADRPEVRAFAEQLSQEEGLNLEDLLDVLGQAEYQQSIIDAISRPAESTMEWDKYQNIFLTKARAKGGKNFLRRHKKVLRRAEKVYGVPAEIIVSILGVETKYGNLKGKYKVLNALMTLGFDYPPRSKFFRKELKEFILLAKEENSDATQLLGSYAGAMGYGQFMPSSFRNYAVDFDGDGKRDIWNNPTDGIGSIANYLKAHGWKTGEPIIVKAFNVTPDVEKVFSGSLKPTVSYGEVEAKGIRTRSAYSSDVLISPLLFNGKKGPEYWLGFNNFYVITRYNRSKLYALSVHQLGQKIDNKKRRRRFGN